VAATVGGFDHRWLSQVCASSGTTCRNPESPKRVEHPCPRADRALFAFEGGLPVVRKGLFRPPVMTSVRARRRLTSPVGHRKFFAVVFRSSSRSKVDRARRRTVLNRQATRESRRPRLAAEGLRWLDGGLAEVWLRFG